MAVGISPDPLEVLIIGAGIAGLSAAIALGKQGHNVVVSKKATELASICIFSTYFFIQSS